MADKMEQFVILAKSARGRAAAELVSQATSEPGIFTYSELLDLPSISDLKSGEMAPHYSLLELFAFGTLPEYRVHESTLPPLSAAQTLKLKQLTVAALAMKNKVIPYDVLRQQLEIPTVRELEDFLITECFYSGIVQGKLDQKRACLLVHDVIGRDVRLGELGELEARLATWVEGSEQLLGTIEARITAAIAQGEEMKRRKAEMDARREEMAKNVKTELDLRASDAMALDEGGSFDAMEDARLDRVDRSERVASRPKSRRR